MADNNPQGRPLSWTEARARLRELLEKYLSEPSLTSRKVNNVNVPAGMSATNETTATTAATTTAEKPFLSWWILGDLDLYAGSLPLSIALFILACISLHERKDPEERSHLGLHPAAKLSIYRGELAASVLLVTGSIVSLWMVRRRRFLCHNDGENAKRREILRFLRTVASDDKQSDRQDSSKHTGAAAAALMAGFGDASVLTGVSVAGTALTDIYPVYRQSGSGDNALASWARIPSLLLVAGDYIALQVGDIAPASCAIVDPSSLTKVSTIAFGDRIELSSFGNTLASVMNQLPRGRSTLPMDSDHLLTLCNKMRVFRVQKAPLDDFIRRSQVPSKPSQIWRQINAMRGALSVIAIVVLVVTAVAVFSRPGATSGDLSLILPLPLLAALGVLPVVAPAFIFFLEVLGTARILVTVHPHASSSVGETANLGESQNIRLLLRYILATGLSRLSLWGVADWVRQNPFSSRWAVTTGFQPSKLIRVPPASIHLLEKLGVATAFTLVDDELACDPDAIPQQLLIPSGKGLKLLDLCPAYDEDESDDGSGKDMTTTRGHVKSYDSDSDSDEGALAFKESLRRKVFSQRRLRRKKAKTVPVPDEDHTDETEDAAFEVQFEDPLWWQHLPSLKCIGLACLLIDEPRARVEAEDEDESEAFVANDAPPASSMKGDLFRARATLARQVCSERKSNQLKYLAECIGFSASANTFGPRGDISPFTERLRLHVLSDKLFAERVEADPHERSSEQSRWWGLIRPDATSVIVEDSRSGACQLLTSGDPTVVTSLCNEAWQGEISTILPLGSADRRTIVETTNSWKLGDLDVAAFSYSPVPHTLAQCLAGGDSTNKAQKYLLDHGSHSEQNLSVLKDKSVSQEWSLIRNQVFLGVLGSLVVPRKEIQKLLRVLNDAGVRFVYFSPRNMRRQKELASQMGIDVAWNCAISLRPLESGEDDPHRMVSNYADWDINAKLPHGVDDVRKHLKEVDNVPLLVSLYTDVTKETTRDMVEIFQEYSDTVIAIGLSHLPWNEGIFSTADISVGIDVLSEAVEGGSHPPERVSSTRVLPSEVEFVSAMASHSCAFRFRGAESLVHISSIIAQGRASLEAAIAAGVFLVASCLSFSFFVLFSACAPSTTIPFVPAVGAVLYLQIVLPSIGMTMAMNNGNAEAMKRVPEKNDQSVIFSRNEGWRMYQMIVLKAIPPALLPQLLHFIAFGELVLHFDPDLVSLGCPGATSWVDVVRCDALKDYSGVARTSSGVLVLAEFVFCTIIASAAFVQRFNSSWDHPPWRGNRAWVWAVISIATMTCIYAGLGVEKGTGGALPWYWYLLAVTMPWICLVWNESLKPAEAKPVRRSEKLRRLQFETRLGAWSPK